jgi:hypothetical protein
MLTWQNHGFGANKTRYVLVNSKQKVRMITLGSVSREQATTRFAFLAAQFRGRSAIKAFPHKAPEFVPGKEKPRVLCSQRVALG